jgi:hypothetical protein
MAKEQVKTVCAECAENIEIDRYIVCSQCDAENDVMEWDNYCDDCNPYAIDVESVICDLCEFSR